MILQWDEIHSQGEYLYVYIFVGHSSLDTQMLNTLILDSRDEFELEFSGSSEPSWGTSIFELKLTLLRTLETLFTNFEKTLPHLNENTPTEIISPHCFVRSCLCVTVCGTLCLCVFVSIFLCMNILFRAMCQICRLITDAAALPTYCIIIAYYDRTQSH